jgi:ribosomal subunit interface protein
MQLQITGKNIEIGDVLKTHIAGRLSLDVERYFDGTARGVVTVMREGHDFRTDCSIHLSSGMLLQSKGLSADAYASFDAAADRLEKRLRRYKRRLKDHHARMQQPASGLEALDYVIDMAPAKHGEDTEAGDEAPPIIAENTTQIQEFTVSEAVMQLDLTEAPFLFFRNASHGGLNVVYRREDGNLGWIDPKGA